MVIDPSQEYPLAVRPDTPLWTENFALVFTDPGNRISALYSIGTWFHDTSIWRECLGIALPDGQVLAARNFGRNTRGSVVSASLSQYEIVEPEKKVRLSYNGPAWCHPLQDLLHPGAYGGRTKHLKLDLDFDATSPVWDMHAGHEKDSTGVAGAMHIEQLGRSSGTLRFDDREIRINGALACRDHSRGSRDVTNYRNHCWINGTFSGGRGIQVYVFKIHTVEGIAMSLATVSQDNVAYPATVEHVEFVEGPEDYGKLQSLVLRSALGEMKIRVQEVLGTVPITMTSPNNPAMGVVYGPHALLFDEGIRMEWNGETGYGWSERGFSKQPI